jgi:exopolysaccharide biosynthesis polyprenyl glycosylphosphotransferase
VKSLIARLERGNTRALRLCGVVTLAPGEGAGTLGNPVPVVGTVAELPALINRYQVDRVIALEREVPPEQMRACVSICTRMGVTLNRTAESLEAASASLGVAEIGDTLLIEVRGFEFTRAQQIVKRAFDLAAAGALLIALSPLLLALSALIKMTSKGRVLYVAPRVGRGGRHFPFYKFRSMVADAEVHRQALAGRNEKRGHLFKVRSDPRVTPIGRFMRRVSLDELPQLLNVLRGDMSLVGPRPLPVRDLEPDGLSRDYRFWAKERCKVLPGLTGLWQVRGRSDLGFDEMLRLDVSYVRNWNLWLDVRILLQTVPAVLRGRGAC